MEKIASYILEEQDLSQKMEFLYYLKKRVNIFFDNSVILKATIAEMFIDRMNITEVDRNTVLTACLLYSCKKQEEPQTLEEIKLYPKISAEFLSDMGFDENFCKICMQHNRYIDVGERTKEGDILELVEQFGGMILHRPERRGFPVDEAMCLLEFRNLKGKDNQYLEQFKQFIDEMEAIRL